MSDEGKKQGELPTIEEPAAALLALLLADRRRVWRERVEEMRWEALMEEAQGLLGSGLKWRGGRKRCHEPVASALTTNGTPLTRPY